MEQKNKAPAECEGRENFVLYRSTCRAVERLPQEQRAQALAVIYNYALDGTPPPETDDNYLQMFFDLALPIYEHQRQKYISGKKGGSVKSEAKTQAVKNNARKKPATDTETYTSEQKEEYRRFMEWGKDTSPFYFDGEKCPPMNISQYVKLRSTYTKDQVINAVEDLKGRRDYQMQQRYKSTYEALSAFLRVANKK